MIKALLNQLAWRAASMIHSPLIQPTNSLH